MVSIMYHQIATEVTLAEMSGAANITNGSETSVEPGTVRTTNRKTE